MADFNGGPEQSPNQEDPQQLYYDSAALPPEEPPSAAPKRHLGLKILVWVVVIIVILALALVLSSMIAGFDTVFDMIDWILNPANTGFPAR